MKVQGYGLITPVSHPDSERRQTTQGSAVRERMAGILYEVYKTSQTDQDEGGPLMSLGDKKGSLEIIVDTDSKVLLFNEYPRAATQGPAGEKGDKIVIVNDDIALGQQRQAPSSYFGENGPPGSQLERREDS